MVGGVKHIKISVLLEFRMEGQAEQSLFHVAEVDAVGDIQKSRRLGDRRVIGKDPDHAALLDDKYPVRSVGRMLQVDRLLKGQIREGRLNDEPEAGGGWLLFFGACGKKNENGKNKILLKFHTLMIPRMPPWRRISGGLCGKRCIAAFVSLRHRCAQCIRR